MASNIHVEFLVTLALVPLASLAALTWTGFAMKPVFDRLMGTKSANLIYIWLALSSLAWHCLALCFQLVSLKRQSLGKIVLLLFSVAALLCFGFSAYAFNNFSKFLTNYQTEQILRDWIPRYNESFHQQFWDSVQSKLSCCGVQTFKDWPGEVVPGSCCSEKSVCSTETDSEELQSVDGCAEKISSRIEVLSMATCVVSFFSGAVSVFLLILNLFSECKRGETLSGGISEANTALVASTAPEVITAQQLDKHIANIF